MVQGNAILVLDLGNSSTKVTVKYGKGADGRYQEESFDLSNMFAFLDKGYEVSDEYTEENSTILSVDTYVDDNHIQGDFCNGELQAKEFTLAMIKPSAHDKKWNLDASALSIRLAFLFAFRSIMQMARVYDPEQLDISWHVVTLLPSGDLDMGRDKLIEMIKSVTHIEAKMPALSFDVEVLDVKVLAEGFCGFAGVLYDNGCKFRTGYEFLKNETVMVFDIGAGTTNCMLIRDNTLIQRSKFTITQGGNNVLAAVRRMLGIDGIDIEMDVLRKGIISGKIKDGVKDVSIVDYVNRAKREVAAKIVSAFQDSLADTDIKMRSVGYVLTCGGGSMIDSECAEIMQLSQLILQSVQRLAPNAEVIEMPRITKKYIDEDTGDTVSRTEAVSPRKLNLMGAGILAEKLFR